MEEVKIEFKDFFVMFLIIGLFIFALISFSINFGSENNAQVNINQNPILGKMFGNISRELNVSSESAENVSQGLIEEEKSVVFTTLGFVFKSILSAGNTFMAMGIKVISSIFIFGQEFLAISPVVTGTLLAIIIGLFVLATWSLVRAGR